MARFSSNNEQGGTQQALSSSYLLADTLYVAALYVVLSGGQSMTFVAPFQAA